jgi:hypothetical protein
MHANDVLRGQGGRPLLVYVGGWFLILTAIPGILFFSLMIVEALYEPQAGRFGALGLDNLTSIQFLAISPLMVLIIVSEVALGYGLLRGRPWSRPLGTYLWVGIGLVTTVARLSAGLPAALAVRSLLWGLLCTGLAYWYFYDRENVRAYYEDPARQPRRQFAGAPGGR